MAMLDATQRTSKIRELNDAFRTTLHGGRVMLTSGFNALSGTLKAQAIERVKTFFEFDAANDPHDEHDFINFEVEGQRFFATIDYYDRHIRSGAEDPSDAEQTCAAANSRQNPLTASASSLNQQGGSPARH